VHGKRVWRETLEFVDLTKKKRQQLQRHKALAWMRKYLLTRRFVRKLAVYAKTVGNGNAFASINVVIFLLHDVEK
jgi:hypothetical protein